ncbi:MAG: hypothetical protein K9H25_19165 [Rhodospirillum sp.]|nr:hypothetical protein [Rhodospirillum sp.]MCF8491228.1 hypothetical protein [Rhodospirillum sp.]MCF8500866.1 hypothetical protein [Rhodospirillum sp.]
MTPALLDDDEDPLPPGTRPMSEYDPDWFERLERAKAVRLELLAKPGPLETDERRALFDARREEVDAFNARFRTTAAYRDFHFARARQLLEDEGIHMDLPDLPDDCAREDVDRYLGFVFDAVEVTNGETF